MEFLESYLYPRRIGRIAKGCPRLRERANSHSAACFSKVRGAAVTKADVSSADREIPLDLLPQLGSRCRLPVTISANDDLPN